MMALQGGPQVETERAFRKGLACTVSTRGNAWRTRDACAGPGMRAVCREWSVNDHSSDTSPTQRISAVGMGTHLKTELAAALGTGCGTRIGCGRGGWLRLGH